ncbi:hypothetical protein OJ998_09860 [Solirubrobacter taibaiensis]|nr:hypothetical protein [Solirubrobacter taibaiensis]
MHSLLTLRRALVGVALAGTAIAVVPSAAHAASSCTFDAAAKTVTVTANGGDQPLVLRNASSITFTDGTGVARSCFSPTTGQLATAFSTTKIRVKATVPAANQHIVIDESNNGRFITAAGKRMSFAILTGSGGDHLSVRMGTNLDEVGVRSTSALGGGPELDLNLDGTPDVGMTAAGLVTVDGGAGSDFLDGAGTTTFQLELLGGVSGNDTLRGGGRTDFLDGGAGMDTIRSGGDNRQDFVRGGADADRAFTDALDSVTDVEDQRIQ